MSNSRFQINLQSGFEFDYGNLFGEGKVEKSDIILLSDRIKKAHEAVCHMRAVGEVKGHASEDDRPEKVLLFQLPYIKDGSLNSSESIMRLKCFGQSLRYKVDAVISFGIGGSYLGNKVLFDVHCDEFWNYKPVEERDGYPKIFFSGNNIDPRRTWELIECIVYEARDCRVADAPGNDSGGIVVPKIFTYSGPIEIGENCFLAYEVMLCTATHEIGVSSKRAGKAKSSPIIIGNGCWIGARAVIMPGVTVGRGCVIAAGALVTKDCEPNGLYVGVPAKRIKDLVDL